MKLKHASLFSGIGGFDLAAEWMGWQNVFHCEWMPFPRQILNYHFPNSISYEDITKTDFTIHRGQIDVLTGGFPCQPYSVAGKRLGKDDERHLWPEMLRAIREIEPRFVVGENVRGLVNWSGGMVFDEVQADLENAGYEVIPFIIPACAVGAPHRRDRVWFIAKNSVRDGCLFGQPIKVGTNTWKQRNFGAGSGFGIYLPKGIIANSNYEGRGAGLGEIQGTNGEISKWNNDAKPRDTSNGNASNPMRLRLQQRKNKREMGGGQKEICRERDQPSDGIEANGETTITPNTKGTRSFGLPIGKESEITFDGVTSKDGITSNSASLGQSREEHRTKGSRLYSEDCKRPNWNNFPTQSPICSGDDGLPTKLDGITFSKWRNESIKGYGNAVVPQVVYEIFKAIQESING
jgi:DNA (cytosine-5)-methyltransferase 1